MPIYQDNSENHPDQGMTKSDMAAAAAVSAKRNEIIIFRDTGCWSRPYIELGHPTKPFHVKGKSSNWGPHAGMVPYNSNFSKAVSADGIASGLKANKESMADGWAIPIQAYLTEDFMRKHLLVPKGSGGLQPIDRIVREGNGIFFHCTKPGGATYVMYGERVSPGTYKLYESYQGAPLLVMTVPTANKPLTGDYDLFAICPSWTSFGRFDRKMDPTLDNPQQKASMARTTARLNSTNPAEVARAKMSLGKIEAAKTPEDPDRGNLTPRIMAVIEALVAAMGGKHPRVHHNAESGRPFAPGAEDGFPLTVFHPKRGIGGYTFLNATINDVADLRDYFTRLYSGGYYPPRNRAWNMQSLRDDREVKAKLEAIFSGRGR